MRAWMMAHLYGAEYQAAVCCAGSSGEVAFRESLRPQFTSIRHDVKGLRTFHITGSCGGALISRIASGDIGRDVPGGDNQLTIVVTSNACSWKRGDLGGNPHLVNLVLAVERMEDIHMGFLYGCSSLTTLQFAEPLVNLRFVGDNFMEDCSDLAGIDQV